MSDMRTLRRLVGFGEPVAAQYLRGVVGLGLVNLGVNGLFALMLAQLSASLVEANRAQLTRSTLLFLGVAILSSVSISFVARALITGATRIEYRIRNALFAAVNAVTLAELEKRDSGDVLSRMNNDMAQVSEMYTGTIQSLSLALFYGLGSVVTVVCIDWRGGLIIIGLASLTLLVSVAVMKPLKRQGAALQDQKASFLSRMSQVAQGATVIRSFNLAEWMTAKVLQVSRHQQSAGVRLATTEAIRSTTDPLSLLAPIGLLVYGALRSVTDVAFVPRLIALIQMQNGVTLLFTTTARTLADLQVKLVSGRRVLELMDLQKEPERLVSTTAGNPVPGNGITVRDVSFGYDRGADIVQNVSFDVERGTTAAVVGPSGGGKSTLFKLLLGLYLPRAGSIAVEGSSIYETPLTEWRHQFAYVPQNAFLFSDTVYANIVGGIPDPGQEAVENAARAANAHDFILQLPQGYQTVLEESGHNLSGGEKQRIAIARAVLQDAPVLLLDEATSALDAENEQQVQEALERLMRGRTTLVIAHRLSTIQAADVIYVLEGGQIVEQGTHEKLMGQAGRYRALVDAGLRSPTHQV
jgi:ATP-binding cassette subfamily B protein